MSEAFTECYWYERRPRCGTGCGVLIELQCANRGKCSFYESESDYIMRRDEFYKKRAMEAVKK